MKKSSRAVVAHAFNPGQYSQEEEASGSLRVQRQPGLQKLVPRQAPKLQTNPISKNQIIIRIKTTKMLLKENLNDHLESIMIAQDLEDTI